MGEVILSHEIEKVVVLARGLGTRMRKADESTTLDAKQTAVADTGVKALIPIGGDETSRPFLDYVLHAVADAGYAQACLVIGPEHRAVREYYGRDLRPRRISISFAIQAKPQGTADAVAAAEGFAGKDGFLMINSDNLYPTAACAELRKLAGPGVALFERDALLKGGAGNIAPQRVMKFAVGVIDSNNRLRRVIEKPDETTLASL